MIRTTLAALALALALSIVGAVSADATGATGCCVCTCGVAGDDLVSCNDAVSDRDCLIGDACGIDATSSTVQNGECVAQHVEGLCADVPACSGAAATTMAPVASTAVLAFLTAALVAIGIIRRR